MKTLKRKRQISANLDISTNSAVQAEWKMKVDELKSMTLSMLKFDSEKYCVELETGGEVRIVEKG